MAKCTKKEPDLYVPKNPQIVSFKADLFCNFPRFSAIFGRFLISKHPQVISPAVARGSMVAGVKGMFW